MIQFSARLQELLQQPVIETFNCVKLGNYKFTTYHSDLTLADGVYIKTDIISSIDNPKLTSTVNRDLYKIKLCDSSFTLLGFYEGGAVGKDFVVYTGFIDYSTKVPDTNNLILVYKGVIESFDYKVSTSEQGEVLSEVQGSNPMADLDSSNPFYTSKDFIRQISAYDVAFDQVYQGAGSVSIKWGKK